MSLCVLFIGLQFFCYAAISRFDFLLLVNLISVYFLIHYNSCWVLMGFFFKLYVGLVYLCVFVLAWLSEFCSLCHVLGTFFVCLWVFAKTNWIRNLSFWLCSSNESAF